MRMKIKAEKTETGTYVMVAAGGGKKEYPQEGREHKTKKEVFDDAVLMYKGGVWDYKNHSIKID